MSSNSTTDPFDTLDDLLDFDLGNVEIGMEESKGEVIPLSPGEIDPRLKLISHSSRCTLHACPRKFQLYRLNSKQLEAKGDRATEDTITFAYGHTVGLGIQSVLEGKTENRVYLDMLLEWDTDLLAVNPRQKKSFWEACFAIQRFVNILSTGFLDDWELVEYQDKPAIELSFQILMPGGFIYRGFVDAVLRNTLTGEIMVLENKTTSYEPNSANYKNSGQALGYSIVLDILFPKLSSYTVLYLAYHTKGREFTTFEFQKSLLQKALWLQELYLDCKQIEMYEEFEIYPMHGENCFNFFKECEYLGLCTLTTENITKPYTTVDKERLESDSDRYQFTVDFYDLIQAQLEKGTEGVE